MTTPPDKSPDSISIGKSIEPLSHQIPSARTPEGFEAHMQSGKQTTPQQVTGPTPMEIARPPSVATAGVSLESILAQSKVTQDTLGEVHKQLNDKNLKLKRSQSHLVKQKLGDANQYLESAAAKLGAKAAPDPNLTGLNGVARFLAMVNRGQERIGEVQRQLNLLTKSNQPINPAEMLSVQVKMGLAQQEIEYTSTLLGKVIQSITQIFNTQL